jgi:hypothetical protein
MDVRSSEKTGNSRVVMLMRQFNRIKYFEPVLQDSQRLTFKSASFKEYLEWQRRLKRFNQASIKRKTNSAHHASFQFSRLG